MSISTVKIPTTLPVLLTNNNRVLLPGIVVRYVIERTDSINVFKDMTLTNSTFIAVVPCYFKKVGVLFDIERKKDQIGWQETCSSV